MSQWPVLKQYEGDFTAKIALPLGGIGTGTVSLGGRGDLRDWEIVNRPAKGFTPDRAFFALNVRHEDGTGITRALEGPLGPALYEGAFGSPGKNHGLPRFRHVRFEAAYPLGQVILSDPEVPVDARLQAFNPFIPADSECSGIPAAILRYVLTNKTDSPLTVSVCGSLPNFIGQDGSNGKPDNNRNLFRRQDGLCGVLLKSEGVDPQAEQWGTMALVTTATEGVTHRTAWANLNWGDSLLDFWDDFGEDGRLEERAGGGDAADHTHTALAEADAPTASLAVTIDLPPRAEKAVTFLLTWHFPNRTTWTPSGDAKPEDCDCADGSCGPETGNPNWIGNYYTTRYRDAWDAAQQTAAALPELEKDTLAFVAAFCDSDLFPAVKEAALFNLSTLRSQTCFRTADGRFYGWEGCGDRSGSCHGSCTHVFNYETATAFLFGDLSRSMREIEFGHATDASGLMSFRVHLPISHAQEWRLAAADGQMGCLMKLYRDWKLSGDEAMLRALWPHARRALEFCWIPGGWDADQDGVMEGCQHNTMDVEYYGPNPQMGAWYLGALRSCEEMARHLGEDDFAATCRSLSENGGRWMDEHLFNGDYYEHHIQPPVNEAAIAPGLRHESMGAKDLADPELQLGAGCLIDQLVGQYMAHVCGLGYLLDPEHVKATLDSIFRYNYKKDLFGHFNHMRTFALQEESAALMATYPKGRRPKRPFPYYNEVMTGFEYAAAVGMLYEEQPEHGLRLIESIRARYDGLKRSPFDEAECGHHYARAMASWSAVLALTGFHYDAVCAEMQFRGSSGPTTWFWSTGQAWGTFHQSATSDQSHAIDIELRVLYGQIAVRRIALSGAGTLESDAPKVLTAGDVLSGCIQA